jgi:hypothetical protein
VFQPTTQLGLITASQRARQGQNQSSSSERIIFEQFVDNDRPADRHTGKPNQTTRGAKRGSASAREAIGSAMMLGLTPEPRKSRS